MKLVLYIFGLLFFSLLFFQQQVVSQDIVALDITAVNSTSTSIPGGSPFDFSISARIVGFPSANLSCTFNFSFDTDFGTALTSYCSRINSRQIDCFAEVDIQVQNPDFELVNGTLALTEGCRDENWTIRYECGNAPETNSFIISSSSADLAVDLIPDQNVTDGNDTVDFETNRNFTVSAILTNRGTCPIGDVQCVILIPEPFLSVNDTGLVRVLSDNPDSTILKDNCSLVVDRLTCPRTDAQKLIPLFSISTNSEREIIMAFELTGNGELNFTISCTAPGLIDPLAAEAFLSISGINVPPPPEPSMASSGDGDDLIINTAVPLAIFGCVMIVLWTIIIVAVVAYCIYSKVTADESL